MNRSEFDVADRYSSPVNRSFAVDVYLINKDVSDTENIQSYENNNL